MKEFLNRFSSRKFLIAVLSASLMYSLGQYHEMILIIGAYFGVEGTADVVSRYTDAKTTQQLATLRANALSIGVELPQGFENGLPPVTTDGTQQPQTFVPGQ
jgi:hypothetical protein